jgi:enoyl-[acyl-carrier-protein] reductase (NADH)
VFAILGLRAMYFLLAGMASQVPPAELRPGVILVFIGTKMMLIDVYKIPVRAGLTGFVAGLARDPRLAARNVSINNLLPGAFDTERLRATLAAGAARQQRDAAEVIEARRQAIPARRFGTAEEFGAFCAFLCSAQAGYLTGQNLLLDGGAYPGVF